MNDPIDLDTTAHEILLAASNHDLDTLRQLLRLNSANVQDSETLSTPLHAAVAACEEDAETLEDKRQMDVDQAATLETAALHEDGAVQTTKLLFENGAIWNDLDKNNETPGDIAFRLGLKNVYNTIVEAGVRAELLLNRLDDFEMLVDEDEDEDEEMDVQDGEAEEGYEIIENGNDSLENSAVEVTGEESVPELVPAAQANEPVHEDVTSARYLASDLSFGGDRILDGDNNAIMMEWERSLMFESAKLLAPETGLRILNIGHGMGIVDVIFQEKKPATHHIIEAHPAVLDRMRKDGWYEKPGVKIHEGRWQDIIPGLAQQGEVFDGIYFDTFAEDYKALKEFFTEHVITLLDQEGRFGFFNGLGADRQVCYDVYSKVVELDLFDAGLDTEWQEISIPDLDKQGEWQGVRRKYWALDTYRMPTCKFLG